MDCVDAFSFFDLNFIFIDFVRLLIGKDTYFRVDNYASWQIEMCIFSLQVQLFTRKS